MYHVYDCEDIQGNNIMGIISLSHLKNWANDIGLNKQLISPS